MFISNGAIFLISCENLLSMHGLLPNTRISQLIGHFDWRQNRPSLIRSKTNIEHKLKRKRNEREKKSKASTAAELCVAGGPLPSTCGHQHSETPPCPERRPWRPACPDLYPRRTATRRDWTDRHGLRLSFSQA